jgi:hypothetical protein
LIVSEVFKNWAVSLLLSAKGEVMAKKTNASALAEDASFVFKGTVLKLKAATMTGITVTTRTATIRVDEIIHGPEALAQYTGQEITVELGGRKKVTKGQQLVFHTNPLLFGDSLAVRSIDQQELTPTLAAAAMPPGDPVKRLVERDVRSRAATADAVVSGRVVSVRVPADVVAVRASAVAGQPSQRISEHDPDWRIAEVQVDAVHRGNHEGKTAEIRFPSSHDVMWHYAPKLHAGTEGLFMLHKAKKVGAAARSAPTQDSGEYVCLNPADVQVWEDVGELSDAIALIAEPETPSE